MGFLDKVLHRKKDDFDDSAFDAGLPPMQDAGTGLTPDHSGTNFNQTGVPSSGVASFMEKSGDDITGLPPFESESQPTPEQQPPTPSMASHQQMPQSTGQQLAHNYMQSQSQQNAAQTTPQEKSSAHSLELIDVKLDAIRSELSAISQRLEKIERTKSRTF